MRNLAAIKLVLRSVLLLLLVGYLSTCVVLQSNSGFAALAPIAPLSLDKPLIAESAAHNDSDFVAPIAPLSLNKPVIAGDAPLEDDDYIPVPLSIISRKDALAPIIVPATIAGDRVFLRSGPGTEYDAVGRISANTPVQVIGKHGYWFQIRERAGKPIYWISSELLKISYAAVSTLFDVADQDLPPPPPPKVGMVRENGLALRDGPGTDYVRMSKLPAGAKLDLIERYEDWFHVGLPGGGEGWVESEFLTIEPGIVERLLVAESIPPANPAMIGVISANNVNVRKGPDSRYPKVGVVNAGVQVALLGKYNDWFKVKLDDGTKAWIFSDLLYVTAHVARRVPVSKDFPTLPATAKPSTASRSGSSGVVNIPAHGDIASFAVQFAGSRYIYGGTSPSGFDCSGFTSYIYQKFGIPLPHSAAAQYSTAYGVVIGSMSDLAPGDLVFFVGTAGERGISHVALYIGGGRVIHAMTPRYGVQVSNIYDSYWVQHYYGALRVVDGGIGSGDGAISIPTSDGFARHMIQSNNSRPSYHSSKQATVLTNSASPLSSKIYLTDYSAIASKTIGSFASSDLNVLIKALRRLGIYGLIHDDRGVLFILASDISCTPNIIWLIMVQAANSLRLLVQLVVPSLWLSRIIEYLIPKIRRRIPRMKLSIITSKILWERLLRSVYKRKNKRKKLYRLFLYHVPKYHSIYAETYSDELHILREVLKQEYG